MSKGLMIWEDEKGLVEIKKLFAPKLTDMEFKFFVGLGKATGLNPFTREIWSIKYDEKSPAQVFIGRDGYRKGAQSHSDYDYHQADAVYQNDDFSVVDGQPRHKYNLKDRGKLIGAFCVAKRHKSSRPMYVFVELHEYSTGRSVWRDKPATMVKKVAEAQCLRACFQDLFGGTYAEEENVGEKITSKDKSGTIRDRINNQNNDNDNVIDMETGELKDYVTAEELDEITNLIKSKEFNAEQTKKAKEHYSVDDFAKLSRKNAKDFIKRLLKIDNP